MNCRTAEPLFSAFLEDDLSQNERRNLEAHLLSCRRCSLAVRELRTTLELLHDAPTFDTSPHFESDLMARIRSGEGLRPSMIEWLRGFLEPVRLRPVFLAGAGACAVWIGVMLAGPNPGQDAKRIADGSAAPKTAATAPSEPAATTAVPQSRAATERAAGTAASTVAAAPPRSNAKSPATRSVNSAPSGYAWADEEWSGKKAGQDSMIPNPDSRYDDEYVTDQFILERGIEGSQNRTITPVSDQPSDDVFIVF